MLPAFGKQKKQKQKTLSLFKIVAVLINKCIGALLNFKMNEITSDNQTANRKINCGENYPTHQYTNQH